MKIVSILVAFAILGLLAPAVAKDAPVPANCNPSESEPLFVRDDIYVVADLTGVYVYEEDNKREGLQRQDAGRDDTCGGIVRHDRLVI